MRVMNGELVIMIDGRRESLCTTQMEISIPMNIRVGGSTQSTVRLTEWAVRISFIVSAGIL